MKKLSKPFCCRTLTALAASAASLLFTGLLAAGPTQAAPTTAAPFVRLPGHMVPAVVQKAVPLGRIDGTEAISLTLALPPRDPAGVTLFLQRLYTPGDPLFHHFLATGQFDSRFGPTQQTYNTVAAFAKANGLSVTQTTASRLFLGVSGPASAVENAFHVHLRSYAAADGRVFHAPDADPSIPAAMVGKISGVIGLQNSNVRHTHLRLQPNSEQPFSIGSGPGGGLTPSDIKAAYSLDQTTLTGAGRTMALFELDGYTPSDIAAYETNFSLKAVPLRNILVDGATGVPSTPSSTNFAPLEVTLDIELMTALAPGATTILVYEAPNSDQGAVDCYNKIATDNIAKEISTSWGLPEDEVGSAGLAAENTVFQKMQTQGQALYAAAGDSGAYDDGVNLGVDDPASQPFVTGVGGTKLATAGRGGGYRSESAWGDTSTASGGGGGISDQWPLPTYQTNITTTNTVVSTTQRNVPDVSLEADPNTGYSIFSAGYGGWLGGVGGTSCAAPLWAAFTALVDQQRITNGLTPVGFINPMLYSIGTGPNYTSGFHDVLNGTNNLFYSTVPGYDNATGWGSFNGTNMLTLLAPPVVVSVNPISSLTIIPTSIVGGLTAQGTVVLANPAPVGDATVTLTSSSALASVPATVTITAGTSSATFDVTTTAATVTSSVSITAAYSGGTRSAVLTVQPAPPIITPLSLAVSPASVGNGASSVGTVTLSGPAPSGGLTVTLSSSDPAATVAASVLVPAGAVSAQFPITTVPVTTQVVATISATLNSVTKTAKLTVQAPKLEPISLAPVSVIGGQSAVATLTLTFPAPAGGAVITLTSSDPSAAIPASVTIPAGSTTTTATVTTSIVQETVSSILIASYAGATQKTVLTINAVLPLGLTITPASVIGGATANGTVTLDGPAPAGGLVAALTTTDPSALIPATVTIPAGASSATFTIPTANVTALVSAQITATLNSVAETATLAIKPIQISALTLNPASVLNGTPVTGTITLNAAAPAGGLSVALSSSSTAATVPASVLVPAGSTTVTFTVATPHVGGVVITALLSGGTQTASLTIASAPGTTFPAGMNMLSAPYDYSGVSLDTLFGYTGVTLATWDTSAGAYALTPTAPAEALHIGRGYWANLPTAVTLTSVGTPADATRDFTIALLPGWNQIGDPFPTTVTLGRVSLTSGTTTAAFDQASTSLPLLVSSLVYRYAPKSGTTPGNYVWVRDTDTIQPGLGYWIYAYQAVTLTIPHP